MEELQKRMNTYFTTRTKAGNGVIKDLLALDEHSHTVSLGDNDYLNVTNHPDVVRAQVADLLNGTTRNGVMSPAFIGDADPHWKLENDMSEWLGKECQLAQSGYSANVGLCHAILKPGMKVYADMFLHMSFYDGLSARRVQVISNKHNDMAELEENIKKNGPGVIMTESLYSINGGYGPLEEVVRIKKQYGCVLIVDESHSLGLYGSEGRGLCHMLGIDKDVDFITGSLSKSFGTRAGVVFGPSAAFVKENSMSYIFSSALMRNDIVRLRAVWEYIRTADAPRQQLMLVSKELRDGLKKVCKLMGAFTPAPSAIVSIRTRDEEQLRALYRDLSAQGIRGAPFAYPAAPKSSPILRFTVNADVSVEDVTKVVAAVGKFFAGQPPLPPLNAAAVAQGVAVPASAPVTAVSTSTSAPAPSPAPAVFIPAPSSAPATALTSITTTIAPAKQTPTEIRSAAEAKSVSRHLRALSRDLSKVSKDISALDGGLRKVNRELQGQAISSKKELVFFYSMPVLAVSLYSAFTHAQRFFGSS